MSDDAAYASFLNKANEPLSATQQTSTSTSSARSKFDPTSTASLDSAPPSISKLLSSSSGGGPPSYTSETDADFEPFFATYSGNGGLPSAEEFAKLLGSDQAKVEEVKVDKWDARGQYKDVVSAVKDAGGNGKVGVYRLEVSGTRVVYFVVTVVEAEGKVVGVKAESVES